MTPVADISSGLVAALAVGLGLWLLLSSLPRDNPWSRLTGIVIASLLTARYLQWRATWTLPPLAFAGESLWPWTFFLLETALMLGGIANWLVLMVHNERHDEASAGEAALEIRADLPAVDVFICTYNEDAKILEKTIVGAMHIDWSNKRVWVLDDGRRDWLRDLAAAKGAGYLTRDDNKDAKAGNINAALTRTDAPFVLILDADFVPRRNFLKRVIGFFDDPRIGVVQTPQHFYNPDPLQHNFGADRSWADEQRFFFDTIQPAKDAWDTAFCCGTSSVVRRTALDALGGFPTDTVTEDILLTHKLYDHGYITRYLNENLSMGLAAEGVGEFLTQRARWCLGNIQQLRTDAGPFSRNRQSLLQRLHFFTGLTHWLLFPHRLLFLLAPAVYWYTGIPALETSMGALVHHLGPAVLANWVLMAWLSRNTVYPLLWDIAQLVPTFVVTRAVITGLLKPHGQKFKVTAKGGSRDQAVVHWQVVGKMLAMIALIAGGMLISAVPAWSIVSLEGRGVNFFWSILNIILLGLVAVAAVDQPRQRKEERFQIDEPTRLSAETPSVETPSAETPSADMPDGWAALDTGRIKDISLTGVKIALTDGATLPDHVRVAIPQVGEVRARLVHQAGTVARFALEHDDENLRDRMIVKLFCGDYSNTVSSSQSSVFLVNALRKLWA